MSSSESTRCVRASNAAAASPGQPISCTPAPQARSGAAESWKKFQAKTVGEFQPLGFERRHCEGARELSRQGALCRLISNNNDLVSSEVGRRVSPAKDVGDIIEIVIEEQERSSSRKVSPLRLDGVDAVREELHHFDAKIRNAQNALVAAVVRPQDSELALPRHGWSNWTAICWCRRPMRLEPFGSLVAATIEHHT